MEELFKLTLLTPDVNGYLPDCYGERKKSTARLARRADLQAV
jgi:hypothetical protein